MEDSVLLKIKRQFSHDEAVAVLQTELAKANFKNGELLSEIEELKHQLAVAKKGLDEINKLPKIKLCKEDLIEARFVEMQKKIKAMAERNKKLANDIILWRNKCLSNSNQIISE